MIIQLTLTIPAIGGGRHHGANEDDDLNWAEGNVRCLNICMNLLGCSMNKKGDIRKRYRPIYRCGKMTALFSASQSLQDQYCSDR